MKLAVVIVTYNRKELLKKCLGCYEKQNVQPDTILVVDNHSTDGTEQFLNEWKQEKAHVRRDVLRLPKNIGGSGGFFEGMQKAVNDGSDWIYISDDDAFPDPQLFDYFYTFLRQKTDLKIAAVCGCIISHGSIAIEHRRRLSNRIPGMPRFVPVNETEYLHPFFLIDIFSYVGTFLSSEALKAGGYTAKDYFIYHDDAEHSLRLRKHGDIVCLPQMRIIHDEPRPAPSTNPSWKKYYSIRNKLDLYRRHMGRAAFCILLLQDFFKSILHSSSAAREIYQSAISDALHYRFGIHNLYRPGWKASHHV